MDFIITLFVILVGGGWIIGKLVGGVLFSKDHNFETYKPYKNSPTIINNSYTQNNLNVTEEQFDKLKDSLKS
ncbi:hypothetical protein [Tenacibaculum caenipelagi]|uniref:Uncharacterized protein n=1 Tax=Tenacibaculum caenipelagi TaxID=1325435 RepID=A0A4R6TE29_9FLAO|nr:hypothetical protein [Tenacibaculum caenipelagi]TDQ27623.1 hypothetical protein DFQ07_1474 [Tenacibaculum caenipelagi]